MLFLSFTSAIFTSGAKRLPRRSRKSRPTTAVARIADLVFYRRLGITGTVGRIALLMIGAGLSYFVGAGLAELMLKAPIPVALLFGAAFATLLSTDPDRP